MAQVHKVQTQVSPELPPPVSPRRGMILVVEDRPDVREGLTQLLELHGFVVRDAADGAQALEYLAAAPSAYALILLDLVLPGPVTGFELRDRLLADPAHALVPTVVVSACERDLDLEDRLRPVAWLEKPFRIDTLLSVVHQHVIPEL